MNEPTELKIKPGDAINKIIGDQTLTLEPIPYGRLKKLMKVIFGAMDQFSNLSNKDIFQKFPAVFEKNIPEIVPLMFNEKKHPFLNQSWVDDNLSLIDMRDIVEKMIIINGMTDFLGKMGTQSPEVPKRKVELTPAS